jgi:hypothetical protein
LNKELININRKKKIDMKLRVKNLQEKRRKGKEEEEKIGKDKGSRRELEKISLKVRFRFLNA